MNGEKERGHKDGGGGRDGARRNEVKRVITVTWKERQKDGRTDRQTGACLDGHESNSALGRRPAAAGQ